MAEAKPKNKRTLKDNCRTIQRQIRWTHEENDILKKASTKSGVCISGIVRDASMDRCRAILS